MSALDEIVKGLIGEYDAGNQGDTALAALIRRIQEGQATYADVEQLASRTGTRAGRLIAGQLAAISTDGRVTEEQARAMLTGLIQHNYGVVSGAAADVQESLNQRAGLALRAVRPEFNRDRVEGLITEVVGKEDVPAFQGALAQQVENVSLATVDDSVRVNAEAHYNAGLSPKIERIADSKCCEWCSGLTGTYEYSRVNNTGNDVFRRHNNCRCQVLYDPGNGKKWQDAHSKRLLSAAESDKIRARRTAGLDQERKTPEQRAAEAAFQTGGKETGGHSYELDEYATKRDVEAAEAYRKICKEYDADRIAKASGFSVEDIIDIKRHVFFEKHKLYSGYGYLYPDYDIAVAWNRLKSGNPEERDIILLKHERLEAYLEKKYGLTLSEAHAMAKAEYNWEKALLDACGEGGEADGLL